MSTTGFINFLSIISDICYSVCCLEHKSVFLLPRHNCCSCTCLSIAFPPLPLPKHLIFSWNSPARGHVLQLREHCFDYRLLAFVQISLDQHILVLFVGNGLCLKIFVLLTSGGLLIVFRRLIIYQTLFAQECWKK